MLLLISAPYSQGDEDPVSRQVSSTIREGDGYSSQLEDVTSSDHQVPLNVESLIGLQLGNTLQDFTAGVDEVDHAPGDLQASVESDPLFSNPSDAPSTDPDNDDGNTQGYNTLLLTKDQLEEEMLKLVKKLEAEISFLKMSLDNCKTFCHKNLPSGDGVSEGGETESEGIDVDHGVGDTQVSMRNGEREGRRLVVTVSSDKAVLQGIAPSVGSKAGTPAWTSSGDPCNDGWAAVGCDTSGYVTHIRLGGYALSGISLLSFSYWSCIIHIPFTYYISLYNVLHK